MTMRGPVTAAAFASAALVLGPAAFADTIVLKNGSRLEGVIEKTVPGPACKECRGRGHVPCAACRGRRAANAAACRECGGTGRVKCPACNGRGSAEVSCVILLRGGVRITVHKSEIVSIKKKEIPPEDLMPPRRSYAARVAALGDEDARGHLALARWALKRRLLDEASRLARRAAEIDPALRAGAREVTSAVDDKLARTAAAEVAGALEHIREGRLAEGLAALEAAARAHADNPLFTDPQRWRAFLEESAPGLAELYGRTLGGLRTSLERRVRLACPKCSGLGVRTCPTCRGTGEGVCPRCAGAGKTWCAECNGTKWRVCVRCGGTGSLPGTRLGTAKCPDCGGRGVVKCKRCKEGRVACKACGGKGRIPRGCRDCGGKGTIVCASCLGTGLRPVTLFEWGPAPEMDPGLVVAAPDADGGRRVPVWQGMRRGCIVTAVRAEELHEGALGGQLAAVIGERREVLLVCVDNRDGREQVEFDPAGQGLRLVTDDARQVDAMAPPDVKALSEKHPPLAPALEQLGPAAVLPGAVSCVLGAFPEGTDIPEAKAVFWGRRDPLQLARHYVNARTIAAFGKTMR